TAHQSNARLELHAAGETIHTQHASTVCSEPPVRAIHLDIGSDERVPASLLHLLGSGDDHRLVPLHARPAVAFRPPAPQLPPSAPATLSIVPKTSMCSRMMLVMRPYVGSVISHSVATSPGWFVPISITAALWV